MIDAKLSYNARDGRKRKLETAFHRYSVVFTGEEFPDGTRADAVYLVLDQNYWEVLNNAPDRPLDYAYLKALSPSAQRFYEIISYRMFTASSMGSRAPRLLTLNTACTAPRPAILIISSSNRRCLKFISGIGTRVTLSKSVTKQPWIGQARLAAFLYPWPKSIGRV